MGQLTSVTEVSGLPKGWYSFTFSNKQEANQILSQNWFYGTIPIMFKKWTPLFDSDSERMNRVPIWVHIPGLPLEFWNPAWLKDLGNVIGTFLEAYFSYLQTHQRAVARILVSMNIRIELREHLNLIWSYKIEQQILDYEDFPFRCHRCHKLGHLEKKCSFTSPIVAAWKRRLPNKDES